MKHAASVHPEPGSNSPLSEKFMSLVHLSMNRSTSFYFVRFIFFKINRYISSSAILLSMFYFFSKLFGHSFEIFYLFPHSLQISQSLTSVCDIFYPITSILFVNIFFLKFIFEALVFKIKNTRLVFFVNLKSFSFHFSLDSVVISHSVTIK